MKNLTLLTLLITFILTAELTTTYNSLEFGKYTPGFRSELIYDGGRFFKTDIGYRKRAVQAMIWYPSNWSGENLTFSDYYSLSLKDNKDVENYEVTKFVEIDKRIKKLSKYGTPEEVKSYMFQKCKSELNVDIADGKFPVLFYFAGGNEKGYENFIMFEYLASHGYVVVSCTHKGLDPLQTYNDYRDIKAHMDDINLLFERYIKRPWFDKDRVGTIGFCLGSASALRYGENNPFVKSLFSMFGAGGIESFREDYGLVSLNKQLHKDFSFFEVSGNKSERDSYVYDNLLYNNASLVRFKDISHGAFTSNYIHLFTLIGEKRIKNLQGYKDSYLATTKYAKNFFDHTLKGESSGREFISKKPKSNGLNAEITEFKANFPLKRAPSYKELITMAENNLDDLFNCLDYYFIKDKNQKIIDEMAINKLGYTFLYQKKSPEKGLKILQYNNKKYPNSLNTFDSIGEAYYVMGDSKKAKKYYKMVLKKDPKNVNALKMLKEIK